MRLSATENEIVTGMARALFVSAWADRQEDRGKTYPGQELMDVAPRTPRYVYEQALRLMGRIEQANGMGVLILAIMAAKADGYASLDDVPDNYVSNFGHYLAMQALGHGVGWFDSHAEFTIDGRELAVPHFEFYLD